MTSQLRSRVTPYQRLSTTSILLPTKQACGLFSVAAVVLFLFVGLLQADIFVSRYDNHQVDRYDDSGHLVQTNFFHDTNGNGLGSEGFACVKLASNRVFTADNSNQIGIFDINTGVELGTYLVGTGTIAALAISIDGKTLYAAAYGTNIIYAVDATNGSIKYQVSTPASHDVAVGPDGNVYATDFNSHLGVQRFSPTLVPIGTFIPDTVLPYAGGMIFDGSGNLWVTNTGPAGTNDGIWEFTGPLNALPGRLLNKTADSNAFPLGLDISPSNPPPPPNDSCKGCIVVAELNGKNNNSRGSVSQIDPRTCTGTITTPGTCSFANPNPYIDLGLGAEPKYVHFSENCSDTGYVEVCKLSCLYNPVSGFFNFTLSNAGTTVGPFSVPVNACSAPIQIPNGTVNVKEAQRLGTVLTGVIAYDYDYFGNQINALLSKNLPFTNANVNVISGDVSTQTVVGFTNCASGPGQLKICKVAGSDDLLNQPFTFTAKGFGAPKSYTVPAGPPPGGYCVVADSYPTGTPVLVAEQDQRGATVTGISVAPPDRGGTQTANSVIAIIDSGTTEVTFTNYGTANCDRGANLLVNGDFETGDFSGWTLGGNLDGNTNVVSGPFGQYSGAQSGAFYTVLGPVGSDATLSQTFATTPGHTYHVCYWLNAVGDMPSDFSGFWDIIRFVNLLNPTTGGVWKQYAYGPFTGTGSDTLSFSFRDDPGYIALDHITVVTP